MNKETVLLSTDIENNLTEQLFIYNMGWTHRGGSVTVKPPNTKHGVEYWVDEKSETVIYTWYNAVSGVARIVEWDYSDSSQGDGVLNNLRDAIGMNRKISSLAGMKIGNTQKRIERRDIGHNDELFYVALRKTYEMYPELPKAGVL